MDDRIRAQHMLIAARDVRQFAAGRRREDLDSDAQLRRALVNAIQEIGEAANKVSPHGRARLPGVDWKQMVGMRNRLVHDYVAINLDIVWQVATQEIQPLITALESAFTSWPLPEPPKNRAS